jgi:maltose O-acetyltransferase
MRKLRSIEQTGIAIGRPAAAGRRRVWRTVREEFQDLHLRLALVSILLAPLPSYVGSGLRAMALRAIGFRIGRGTVFWGMPRLTGSGDLYTRLTVGQGCWFNLGCHLDLEAPITIGDRVSFGHEVLVMTSTHDVGPSGRRAGALRRAPVTIGDGAWLGSRCTILPGLTIGRGAVVAAGALVTKDVLPDTLVAGVPARAVRELS